MTVPDTRTTPAPCRTVAEPASTSPKRETLRRPRRRKPPLPVRSWWKRPWRRTHPPVLLPPVRSWWKRPWTAPKLLLPVRSWWKRPYQLRHRSSFSESRGDGNGRTHRISDDQSSGDGNGRTHRISDDQPHDDHHGRTNLHAGGGSGGGSFYLESSRYRGWRNHRQSDYQPTRCESGDGPAQCELNPVCNGLNLTGSCCPSTFVCVCCVNLQSNACVCRACHSHLLVPYYFLSLFFQPWTMCSWTAATVWNSREPVKRMTSAP